MRKHARDEQEQGPAEERGAAWHHQDKTIDGSHFGCARKRAFRPLGGYFTFRPSGFRAEFDCEVFTEHI